MKRLARAVFVMVSLGVIGCVVSLVPQGPAVGAGGAPVNIVSPLPLPVTGNVGVNNFPLTQNVSFNGAAQPVTFSSTSSSPVFTSDVNAGVLTHDGQKGSNLVTLTTQGISAGDSLPFNQLGGDGTSAGSGFFSVPSAQVFVVTDIEWTCEGGTAGNIAVVGLAPGPFGDAVVTASATVNADGVAGGNVSLNGGVLVGSGQTPQIFTLRGCSQINGPAGSVVTVHGYLAPNV